MGSCHHRWPRSLHHYKETITQNRNQSGQLSSQVTTILAPLQGNYYTKQKAKWAAVITGDHDPWTITRKLLHKTESKVGSCHHRWLRSLHHYKETITQNRKQSRQLSSQVTTILAPLQGNYYTKQKAKWAAVITGDHDPCTITRKLLHKTESKVGSCHHRWPWSLHHYKETITQNRKQSGQLSSQVTTILAPLQGNYYTKQKAKWAAGITGDHDPCTITWKLLHKTESKVGSCHHMWPRSLHHYKETITQNKKQSGQLSPNVTTILPP